MTTPTPSMPEPEKALPVVAWKLGDEFAPYHPSASHCNQDYRDGWNHCYRAAEFLLASKDAEIERLRADARRYQWLICGKNQGNRYPHLTQYPCQPDLDKVRIPQMIENSRLCPENINAAIDAALAAQAKGGEHG